jgi:hypothetical protein
MKVRLTFTDYLILFFVILALLSFASKYIPRIGSPEYDSDFSGSQIYSAVAFCENLESKGFLYTVYVKGFFTSDYTPFEKEGFLVGTGRGNFTLKLPTGETFSVGGGGSYLEDVQAEHITVHQKSKSTVMFSLVDFEAENGEQALQKIRDAISFIHYPREEIAVSATVSIDASLSPQASEEAFLESQMSKNVFHLKGVTVRMKEDGFAITVEKINVDGFSYIFSLLSPFKTGRMYFSDTKVFFQTAEEIDPHDIDILERHTDPAIVPGSIHVRV